MQPEMKLALSGLLNPREGVVSLFCSSSCASYHCHTSDSKLIELKMQELKRKAAPAFLSVYAEAKRQKKTKTLTVKVIPNHHLIFNLRLSPMDRQ